ncbi:MAG: ATP-dependent RNA helicase HrpA [Planctomycetes bacterium]|nr:ATP-dependent RNA helicase HrpA [Planctomycetota bacterium]
MSDAAQELERLHGLLPQVMLADVAWARQRLDAIAGRIARGQPADRTLGEVAVRLDASVAEVVRRSQLPLTLEYPANLPVAQHREEILTTLAKHRAVVLTGETGSGKTTQLPKLLLESGYGRRGMIALTQPRRVAAVAMGSRIRDEMKASEGVVAHSVRFDDRANADTLVRVMTDGLLLAEAISDPDFLRYDAIVIDEAHERSLNIDLLLGLLLLVRRRRPDLAVIVSSASIAAERFAGYLADGGAEVPVVAVQGRTFPVDIRWQPPTDDDIGYLGAALSAIRGIHDTGEAGDVLCFLPTERDILEARRRLHEIAGMEIMPLFSRLTPQEQQRVFAPSRRRKVVLATNIAETSLTIPGIRFVVDTGLARLKRYQASSRTERLPVEAVSQASCIQRAGRAGRIEAGVCIRLYRAEDFSVRDAFTSPEILRSNLAGVLLQCLGMGLGDPERFPWLEAPSAHAWNQARGLLDELGALDERAADGIGLSALGRQLSALPADPQVARILLAGVHEGVPHEACIIAAFLSVQDPRVRPLGCEAKADAAHRRFVHEAGDLASVLKLWEAYQEAASNSAKARLCEQSYLGFRRMREWSDVRHQLWHSLREGRRGKPLPPTGHAMDAWPLDRVHRAVLAGMLGNVLLYDREERCYRGAGDRRLHVHPGSALKAGKVDDGKRSPPPPPWLVACEVVETSRLFARLCAPIDPLWVIDLAGERVKRRHRDPHWHAKRKQVVCRETVSWKGLPLSDGRLVPYERVDPLDATRVFITQALVAESEDASALEREFPFVADNRATARLARGLRERLRDPSLWIDDSQMETFYHQRFGLGGDNSRADAPVVASTDALRRFIATHGGDRLRVTLRDLADHALADLAAEVAPLHVLMGGVRLPLRYFFAPGDAADGTTLEIAEQHLAQVDALALDWLVPARLEETIEAYLQQIPKEQRRRLIPLAETATALSAQLAPLRGRQPLLTALIALIAQRLGQTCPPLDQTALPAHLRLRFRIVDAHGAESYAGRDPRFLAAQVAAVGDRLRLVRAEWESTPATTWPGDCPPTATVHGITGHLAVVRARDATGAVAVRRAVFGAAEAAAAWHDDGIDAALEAAHDQELAAIATAPATARSARVERAFGQRLGLLRRQVALAVLHSGERGVVRDQQAFSVLNQRAGEALKSAAAGIDGLLDQIAERSESLRNRLRQGAKSLAMATVARGVGTQLDLVLAPGWLTRLPWSGIQRLPAFLDGLGRRLDGAGTRPQDMLRASERITALLSAWQEAIAGDPRLIAALGLSRSLRELAAVREETLLGLVVGGGSGAGFAEGRLRDGLATAARRIQGEVGAQRRLRDRALDVRGALQRLPPGPRRDAVMAEGDHLLASYPTLGMGVDLLAERQQLEAWCERAALIR